MPGPEHVMGPMIPGTGAVLPPPVNFPEPDFGGVEPPAWDIPTHDPGTLMALEDEIPGPWLTSPGPILQAGVIGGVIGVLGPIIGGLIGGGVGEAVSGISQLPDITGIGGAQVSNGNGVDLWGHAGTLDGVPVGGPGVPEPPSGMVAKQWKTKAFSKVVGEYWVYFFRLLDGRIMCYNGAKRSWKIWRPKKPIVLYRGSVTLSQAVRAQTMLDKLWKRVAKRTKALKLA